MSLFDSSDVVVILFFFLSLIRVDAYRKRYMALSFLWEGAEELRDLDLSLSLLRFVLVLLFSFYKNSREGPVIITKQKETKNVYTNMDLFFCFSRFVDWE